MKRAWDICELLGAASCILGIAAVDWRVALILGGLGLFGFGLLMDFVSNRTNRKKPS